jgi:AcrR family transcriptional regulator
LHFVQNESRFSEMNSRSLRKAAVQPKLRSRLRELTGEAILEAAEQVFAELGQAAGMDAIAQRAGVAVGTLYNHFRDRDTLVDALFEVRATAVLERMRDTVRETDGLAFRPRLVALLETLVATTSQNARFREVVLMAEQRKPRKQAMLERIRVVMAPLLEQGERDGELRPDPYRLQPAFLLGQLRTALIYSNDAPQTLPRSAVAALVVDQFLDGAGART